MHRLFVAIRPPEDIVDLLVDIMDDSPEMRWVPADNIHLTLRFIGEVDRPLANDIVASLGRVHSEPFTLRLLGTGMFDNRGGGSVWAGVEPKQPVSVLAAKVERACQSTGIEAEHRAFHPHVTIARYRKAERALAQDFLERTRAFSTPEFAVDRFALFESRLSRHGAHYEEVASYSLA